MLVNSYFFFQAGDLFFLSFKISLCNILHKAAGNFETCEMDLTQIIRPYLCRRLRFHNTKLYIYI